MQRKRGSLKAEIKKLYIEKQLNDADIALRLKCNRQTVQYHKKNDREKNGVDWDELRANKKYAQISSTENFEKDKQDFLITLFNAFKKEQKNIEKIKDPKERLDRYNAFANNYYKFTKPSVNDCKGVADKASRVALNSIIDIASSKNKTEVILFLDENFEEIVNKTVQNLKELKK